MSDNIFHQVYNGLLRFSPLKTYLQLKENRREMFPPVGFLTKEKKTKLEQILKIAIIHDEYFEQALLHRSYIPLLTTDRFVSNERLEFLGDAVLGMIIAEYLFSLHTKVREGELTKMRSWLVNKQSLALCARKLHLEEYIMMSFSATKSMKQGGDSILSDALEAVIGAIYIDSGIDLTKKFIQNTLLPLMSDESFKEDTNYKSILLEHVQAQGKQFPRYIVISEVGPDHDKEFLVGVYVENELLASGKGKSKKQAEQAAAQNALQKNQFSSNYENNQPE